MNGPPMPGTISHSCTENRYEECGLDIICLKRRILSMN